ncbi:hypothetical protein GGR95_002993 [Sulfitobacter undariae]|uniref:Uncharacterized protein n=1 Tax=Sulfitobacter undariae TaxID=1563671 RepID=A0A7W6EBV5_9RHOB|nr:hypothetical protein [Sulfitobacter undariae]MBB3995338.1 hypothetical protein [Sulfitobacter undariae]
MKTTINTPPHYTCMPESEFRGAISVLESTVYDLAVTLDIESTTQLLNCIVYIQDKVKEGYRLQDRRKPILPTKMAS